MIIAAPVSPSVGAAGERSRMRGSRGRRMAKQKSTRSAPADAAGPRAAALHPRRQTFDNCPSAAIGPRSPVVAPAPTAPTTVKSP